MEITAHQKRPPPASPGQSSARKKNKHYRREITALPRELIEKIFANLDGRDLVICKGVSTAWQNIIETSPVLAFAFYRRYHPLSPIPQSPLPRRVEHSYGETLGWLARFSQEGNSLAARLDQLLKQGQPRYWPQILFFTTARVLAQAKAFDDCQVCTIKHPERVRCARLSPDQQHLVVTFENIAMVRRRRNGQWQEIATLPQNSGFAPGIFSPNGDYFIQIIEENIAQIWETFTEQWRPQTTFSLNRRIMPRISADGHFLLFKSVDGTAQISRQVNGQWQKPTPLPGSGDLQLFCFHPLDNILVTNHYRGIIKIWRLVDTTWQLDTIIQEPFNIFPLLFSPDGLRLLVTSLDSPTVKIYQSADQSWRLAATLELDKFIHDLQCGPKGDHFVAHFSTRIGSIVELEYTVNIWRLANNRWQKVNLLNADEFRHACFSPEGDRLLTVSRDQAITLWQDVAGQWQQEATLPRLGEVTYTCFSPHGYLAMVCDKTVTIWGASAGTWQKKAELAHDHEVYHAIFSFDGQCMLAEHFDCDTASIWTLKCKNSSDFAHQRASSHGR